MAKDYEDAITSHGWSARTRMQLAESFIKQEGLWPRYVRHCSSVRVADEDSQPEIPDGTPKD